MADHSGRNWAFGNKTGGHCRGLVLARLLSGWRYQGLDTLLSTDTRQTDLGIGRVHHEDGFGLFFGSLDWMVGRSIAIGLGIRRIRVSN